MSRRDEQGDSRTVSLPHSIEAEQSVLGALMLPGGEALPQIADWLEESDFYRRDHQLVYHAIRELADRPSKVHDVITVMDWFETNALLREVENGAYLVQVSGGSFSAANVVAYAEIVKEKANLRRGIEIGTKLAQACLNPNGRDSGAIIAEATAALSTVRSDSSAVGLVPYRNHLLTWFTEASKRYTAGAPLGLLTPWAEVNDAIAGLQDGQVIVIAARPNMGKSIMAFQIARALGREHHGAAFSMEMTGDVVVGRDIAAVGHIPHTWAQCPTQEDDDCELHWDRVTAAIRELRDVDILIDTQAQLSSAQIVARARRAHRQKRLRFIIVDHMHEMALPGEQGETIERGQAIRDLKALGKELGCPVIVLAQLNRNVGARAEKRPNMTDLRGSGAIEEVADLVLFLHRPDYYDENDRPGLVEVIVGKGRNVRTGRIVALRNRYDQMRLDSWGDDDIPAAKAADEGRDAPMGYGGARKRGRVSSAKGGLDRAAGES